jgi:SAM-dependent methyltransferase
MNKLHVEWLSSPDWARMLEENLLPWIEAAGDLGDDVLEIGPGPGLTTDLLRRHSAKLTAVEIDEGLAEALRRRLAGTNVTVVCADAAASGLDSDRFSAATCFTMLHHVPSAAQQDKVLAEVCRMLRPGGLFLAEDGKDSEMMREFHLDDVFVPVDPATLPSRLVAAGLEQVEVEEHEYGLRFLARKP